VEEKRRWGGRGWGDIGGVVTGEGRGNGKVERERK